jgi:hypothetical protein
MVDLARASRSLALSKVKDTRWSRVKAEAAELKQDINRFVKKKMCSHMFQNFLDTFRVPEHGWPAV